MEPGHPDLRRGPAARGPRGSGAPQAPGAGPPWPWEAVRYQIDGRTLLVLEAQEDGTIAARRELLPYFVEVRGVAGRIERGLREDAVEFGMPARVVSDLADIFGWDVDVAGDLRPGDEFRVVYEDIW